MADWASSVHRAATTVLAVLLVATALGPVRSPAAADPVTPVETASAYVAVVPARLLDTRASGASPGDGSTTRVPVAGRAGVPADATAVALNVTATDTTAPGFVTVWPAGLPRPEASNLNVERPGQTVPNLVIVPLGDGGAVDVFALAATDLVVDVVGAWQPAAGRERRSARAHRPDACARHPHRCTDRRRHHPAGRPGSGRRPRVGRRPERHRHRGVGRRLPHRVGRRCAPARWPPT